MTVDVVFSLLGTLALLAAGVLGVVAWRVQAARRGWVPWTGEVVDPLEGSVVSDPHDRPRHAVVQWRAPDGRAHRTRWATRSWPAVGTEVPLKVDPLDWSRGHVEGLLGGGGVYALAACLLAAVGVMLIGFGGMVGSILIVEGQA